MTGPVLGGFKEASHYTGLSRRTLGRSLPQIEHIRIGSRVLFTQKGLDDFLAKHRVPARPDRRDVDVQAVVRRVMGRNRKIDDSRV